MFHFNAPAPVAAYGAAYADVLFTTNSPVLAATATVIKLPPEDVNIAVQIVNPDLAVGVKSTIYGSNDGLNWDTVVAEFTVPLSANKLNNLSGVAYAFIKVAMKQDTTPNSVATASIRVVAKHGS